MQEEKAAEDLERLRKRKAETLKKPKETKDQKPGKAAKSAVKSFPESKTQEQAQGQQGGCPKGRAGGKRQRVHLRDRRRGGGGGGAHR